MKKPLGLLVVLPLVTLLAACGDGGQASGVRVVASFYPFAFVAEQVGGRHVHVDNLTSPGVEPHDVELKPKQVSAVQASDLVVYQRGFQAAVDDAVGQADRSSEEVLDVAKLVRLDHADAHDHEDGAEHDEADEHEPGGELDPHTWLDPRSMVAITRAVADRLSQIDSAHAATFAANADRLVHRMERLDTDFAAGLRTCRIRTIVTSHASFHYLAERYDLTQVPIAGLEPTDEPSPRQLAEISSLVRREGITTIFTDVLVSPVVAETVARETGARTATLDPIEGLGESRSDETYLTLMRRNLDALRTANDCS